MTGSFLLGTNVISELSNLQPDRKVEEWLQTAARPRLYLSCITLTEVCQGIAVIAATALTHGLTLVTRNVKHFEHLSGLVVFNPWVSH